MNNMDEHKKLTTAILHELQDLFSIKEQVRNRQAGSIGRIKNGLDKDNLSQRQLEILSLINREPNSTNTRLSKLLNISKPAISRLTSKLVEQRLIEFNYFENNKSKIYHLTSEGKTVAATHDILHKQATSAYEKILSTFSDTELQVVKLFIQRLRDHLQDSLN
ncbi:MAG: MarR family transcriptional regulator [Liquorilactobacillus hordei]|uniref:MarR family winged helix-turn-helix transcriptional regulator n=1 Tax=Liquorilactobacillus hordei TaxID=468911 RepID=UPI0039E850B9